MINMAETKRSVLKRITQAKILGVLGIVLSIVTASSSFASDGQPVAIRYWPNNCISIETMWNFQIVIGVDATSRKLLPRTADVEFVDDYWEASEGNILVLDRKPNETKPTLNALAADQQYSTEAIHINRVVINGSESSKLLYLMSLQVDGVNIVHCKNNSAQELVSSLKGRELPNLLKKVDVLLLDEANDPPTALQTLAELVSPKVVLLCKNFSQVKISSSTIEKIEHNTIAISKSSEPSGKTRWVKLGDSAWKMEEPLAGMFAKKEAACLSSRLVFKDFSSVQMNFRPANGTHTPRWNAEHMMGRELLFFSQIYHAVDPSIPIMDLNPKQMPNEYQAAHLDWTGAEEAMQMDRVEAFTRRYAYLLNDMILDQKAKGSSFWTPKALLLQMEKHYSEHSANVVKKKSLVDWPEK